LAERELYLRRFLSVAYGLSDAEIDVFYALVELNKKSDTDEVATKIKLSKSRISLILKKLSSVGLVEKEKVPSEKGGRPKFLYYVNREAVAKLLKEKGVQVCDDLQKAISELLKVEL
jgi:predicted transcriptional regulator